MNKVPDNIVVATSPTNTLVVLSAYWVDDALCIDVEVPEAVQNKCLTCECEIPDEYVYCRPCVLMGRT